MKLTKENIEAWKLALQEIAAKENMNHYFGDLTNTDILEYYEGLTPDQAIDADLDDGPGA